MGNNMVIRLFLLIVGNALALLLGLLAFQTTSTNLLGWFLFAVSIVYIAGGVTYVWQYSNDDDSARHERGNLTFWGMMPGIAATFFVPVLDYICLPMILPRMLGMQLAGSIIITLGLFLRVWTRSTLRSQYSGYLSVKIGRVMMTSGPYQIVRHPGYAGFLLMALGLSIGYCSLIGIIVILVLLVPGLAYRMKIEESLLKEEFGDTYSSYARKIKRLLPGIW